MPIIPIGTELTSSLAFGAGFLAVASRSGLFVNRMRRDFPCPLGNQETGTHLRCRHAWQDVWGFSRCRGLGFCCCRWGKGSWCDAWDWDLSSVRGGVGWVREVMANTENAPEEEDGEGGEVSETGIDTLILACSSC